MPHSIVYSIYKILILIYIYVGLILIIKPRVLQQKDQNSEFYNKNVKTTRDNGARNA